MSAPRGKKTNRCGKIVEPIVIKFPDVNIFIVDRKIQRVRFEHLKKLARKKGFCVVDSIDTCTTPVTHIVAELENKEDVLDAIRSKSSKFHQHGNLEEKINNAEVVSMEWFTACMEEQRPVKVTDHHRVKEKPKVDAAVMECKTKNEYQDAKFTCQRRTLLKHHNKKLTDALETLEKHAEFLGGDQNQSRALAFRKASAALKAVPKPVRSMRDIEKLYDLRGGKHCKKVIEEFLEDDFSTEIDNIIADEWFQTMELFTGIFGCGSATARKWYDKDMRSLEDVLNASDISLTKEQRKGIKYYKDLNTPVCRIEADVIRDIVVEETEKILPGATIVITGGFSRGKDNGHDVDLLISHPEEGKEEHLLEELLKNLFQRQLLEYTNIQNNSYTKGALSKPAQARRSHLDHYERCFSIFRLPIRLAEEKKKTALHKPTLVSDTPNLGRDDPEKTCRLNPEEVIGTSTNTSASGDVDGSPAPKQIKLDASIVEDRGVSSSDSTSWVARRVDLIVAPASQYAYALMGWTGSRMFNRSIRDYANKEMSMTLTSHGLYDKVNNKSLPAATERDIFKHLKLEYREPWERNC